MACSDGIPASGPGVGAPGNVIGLPTWASNPAAYLAAAVTAADCGVALMPWEFAAATSTAPAS